MSRASVVAAAVVLGAAVLASTATGSRSPTSGERTAIGAGLPSFYHQACVRSTIRVSTVDRRFAAVFFRFVAPNRKGCSPFDGQVLMKRITATRWKKVGEGSEWPCAEPGVSIRVIKDLFPGCIP